MAALLDVNALIALVDSDHVGHRANGHSGSKSTIAPDGPLAPTRRTASSACFLNLAHPSGRRTPAEVIQTLIALKDSFGKAYHFWPDDISLSDSSAFNSAMIAGSRQVTDVYLLGLAAHHKSKLVSFDQSLPWHVISVAAHATWWRHLPA